MKKVILTVAVLFAAFCHAEEEPTFQADVLTGDTKLSCEAILCLSSGTRPGECSPSISKYFSIKEKKWSDTVRKRKQFLQLCPVGDAAQTDNSFRTLRDEILTGLDCDCSLGCLNREQVKPKRVCNDDGEHMHCHYEYEYRINPDKPQGCVALINHGYTDINYKYECSGEWYSATDWRNGYKLEEISAAQYNSYRSQGVPVLAKQVKIRNGSSGRSRFDRFNSDYDDDSYTIVTKYFKKITINKNCWVNK